MHIRGGVVCSDHDLETFHDIDDISIGIMGIIICT